MTTTYKVHINNRDYSSWTYYDTKNFNSIDLPIIPLEKQLLTNDVFSFKGDVVDSCNFELVHSSNQLSQYIPGVLVLKNNKTYGRETNKSGKITGRFYYKCIPDDMRLPPFLIPYEIKKIGFSKVFSNVYVTFQYKNWLPSNKYPTGTITQNVGCIEKLDNFYEYQLYCKSLNTSIQKFNKDVANCPHITPFCISNAENVSPSSKNPHTVGVSNEKWCNKMDGDIFKNDFLSKYPSVEDRTNQEIYRIFSIDPAGSVDFDDAISIEFLESGKYKLSIYISNVTLWIDYLHLWESFSKRVSTIYLPDRKRPMLPTILSDCLCSLQENQFRIAFVMDTIFSISSSNETTIETITYSNAIINIYKNYCYEEPALLVDKNYKLLFTITKQLSRQYKYMTNIKTSHDVVAYLMIFMNYHTAKEMIYFNNGGIFRSTQPRLHKTCQTSNSLDHIPEEILDFIKILNSSAGNYVELKEGVDVAHDLLQIEAYIHITSPIRRIVDLLNIIKFQENKKMVVLTEKSIDFYTKWINDLEYINTSMRSIRKVQNDCSLLHLCSTKPETLHNLYDGVAFDKLERSDGLKQYTVYIPELKMVTRLTTRDCVINYSMHKFQLYLFNDEESFKKKIRLQIVQLHH